MAKMNLSVIMQTIDKTSSVVKKITSTQSKYAKQLGQVKEQSQKISDNQALISNFRKTGVEASKNKTKLNGAKDKLAQLNEKMSASKKPSAALQNQFKKQQQAVKNLKTIQGEYTKALTKTQNKLKTAGVNVNRLSSEEKRLSTEYNKRISQMDKLAKKEQRLQKVRSKLSKFKMPSVGGAALAKGGAILGGLSFAGLFSQLNGAASEMDKLAKSARNLDMPVEDLQAMQSQAEHAGVSSDTMTASMTRLTKRLGTLQKTGSGALGSFLKKSKSPLYEELKNAANTQVAHEKILESFSKLKTNQEQMAFADAAYGQDGRKMLIMLREGTEGLTKAREKFNETGGGAKGEDTEEAEKFKDALQDVGEIINSIKFAALTPIMKEMTGIFTEFSEKFKNMKWREEAIGKVTAVVKSLFNGFKWLASAVAWASQNIPELITVIALLKIGMFALNVAMSANPISLWVAGIAAIIVIIGYFITKAGGVVAVWNAFTTALSESWSSFATGLSDAWNSFTTALSGFWQSIKETVAIIKEMIVPAIEIMGGAFDRVKAGFVAGINVIKAQFLVIPRAIMKALSLIPNKLLPDGWGDSIKNAQKQLEEMNSGIVNDAKANIEYAVTGATNKPLQSSQKSEMLKHPSIQSKSQVEVRIKSDKPVEITQAKSDKHTEMMVDTGELLGAGF